MTQGLGLTGRILIAEDNQSIAEPLARVLRRSRFQVEVAADGISALQKLATAAPDLLLLDLQLPKLHGVELLRKLRQSPKTRHLPVVIISGVYRGDQHVAAARKLGVQHYLEKPFRIGDLLEAIQAALQQADQHGAKPLAQELTSLFLERFSGSFTVEHTGRSHRIDLHLGRPVHIAPGFVATDLGDFLRRKGKISRQIDAYYRGPGGFRAECLVEVGAMQNYDLQGEKLSFLGDELLAGMALGAMPGTREPGGMPEQWQPPLLNLPRLLHAHFRRQRQTEQRKRLLEQHGRLHAGFTDSYWRYINFLDLSEDERRLLARLDGQTRLADAVHGLSEVDALLSTLNLLKILRLCNEPFSLPASTFGFEPQLFNEPLFDEAADAGEGFIDFADVVGQAGDIPLAAPPQSTPQPPPQDDLGATVRTTHQQLQGKDYYQIFGMTQGNFSVIQLKERYFELTHRFGPDLLMQLGGAEADLAGEILSIVSNAYNTLSNVVMKERYDELLGADKIGLGQKGDDRFQAQVQFQSGLVFLQMEEWDNAEHALRDAATIRPDNGRYLAHLAWAIYKNPGNASSKAMLDKARQMLAKAITLDRTAEAFAFKGWMYLDTGQESLAQAEFTKALKLDARQQLARQGLRLMEQRREASKKGLFGRMFRS